MPGTPHQLSDDGGQEGLGWCGLRGVTLNLESFHFSALQGGARPDRGSHGPRRSALRAGPAESGLATAPPVSPGDPAGETVPAAASRRSDSGAGSRKVPGREEPPRNSEWPPPTARPAPLTLRSLRPSPRSHPPRRYPPWGPWRVPRRAPLAGAGVTRDAFPPGRPAQPGPARAGWAPSERLTARDPANNSGATPRRALSWPRPARPPGLLPPRPSPLGRASVCARKRVSGRSACARGGVHVSQGMCVRKRACARGVSARGGMCAEYVRAQESVCMCARVGARARGCVLRL